MLIYSIHGYYTYQRSGIGQRVEPSREPVKLWVSLGFGDTATVPGSMFNWGFDAIGAIYCIFFCKFASPMYNRSSLAKYHCPKKHTPQLHGILIISLPEIYVTLW